MNDSRPWPPRTDDDYRQEALVQVGDELTDRLAKVRLMVFDADGVLTPGNLIYSAEGEALKEFHSHDSLGLVMARLFNGLGFETKGAKLPANSPDHGCILFAVEHHEHF